MPHQKIQKKGLCLEAVRCMIDPHAKTAVGHARSISRLDDRARAVDPASPSTGGKSQGAGIGTGTGAVIAERPGVGDSRGDRACKIPVVMMLGLPTP